MAPTRRHGKICYLEIPTTNIERSVAFYQSVLGADAPEITARFADLDGNVIGLYQEPDNH